MKKRISLDNKTILITGVAGFIGSNLAVELLRSFDACNIIGVDSLTDYNPIALKEYRLDQITNAAGLCDSKWSFQKIDIADIDRLETILGQSFFLCDSSTADPAA